MLIARRKDRLDQLAQDLRSAFGARVEVMESDLALERDTAAVAERLAAEGQLALLVNNAGFGTKGLFWKAPLEGQEAMHRVHVMATVRLTHAAMRGMVARGRGAVINVASIASFARSPGNVSYCATKSWMATFTEALHLELLATGSKVKVQALCPGYTYSEFHDRLGVNRAALGGPSLLLTAERVVDASLAGLERGKLFVVPGWQYRFIAAVMPKLPVRLRVFVERKVTRSRYEQLVRQAGG